MKKVIKYGLLGVGGIVVLLVGGVITLGVIAALLSGGSAEDAPQTPVASVQGAEDREAGETQTVDEEAPASPELTRSQSNAIRSAENYIGLSPFSRTGLIKQLEFEKYSTEDATLAVDSIVVDWNEQAAKSAERYLDLTSFSREGLINQLTFEGYTAEQAEYGVSQTGL